MSTTPHSPHGRNNNQGRTRTSLSYFGALGNEKHSAFGQYSHAKPLKSWRIPVGQYWANFGTVRGLSGE